MRKVQLCFRLLKVCIQLGEHYHVIVTTLVILLARIVSKECIALSPRRKFGTDPNKLLHPGIEFLLEIYV